METSEDSYPVQRHDHDYYGNSKSINGQKVDRVTNTKNADDENELIMATIEPEKKVSDSEINDYEVIEEEIVESSSTAVDFEEDIESKSNENIASKDNDDINEADSSKQEPNDSKSPVVDEESSSSSYLSNLETKSALTSKLESHEDSLVVANESKENDRIVTNADSKSCTEEKSTHEKTTVVDQKSESFVSSKLEYSKGKSCFIKEKSMLEETTDVDLKSESSTPSKWEYSKEKSYFCVRNDDTKNDNLGIKEENDSVEKNMLSSINVDSSAMSNISGDEATDFNDDTLADEIDGSDVSSSIAENETIDVPGKMSATQKPRKRSRQPPIMIGYRKRRKMQHTKKHDEDSSESVTKMTAESETSSIDVVFNSEAEGSVDDDKSESSRKSLEKSSSEENLNDSSPRSMRSTRKFSGSCNETVCADKYCWICHKDGGNMFKCIACPRVYHTRCHVPSLETLEDSSNFHCPECSAVLKADNINTRSPVLVTVNLEQLCTLLKHIINILKAQKDAHFFWGPVDTKEFPHYREYVVYPMDISVLEKNVKNKIYGCTEAFLADVKWIVHNSIVFNSKAAKITNVAKNLLKLCKREIQEIETCAECYYNSLVRRETWFIEVCKRPHLLVWAKLKGYPPWPAKAMKYKEGNVDCRFFGAHDKAWVPLKDCFLYSKLTPQPVKIKRGSHLEGGIQELEKHIKKLKEKHGTFVYPTSRIPYCPSQEAEQIRIMLPNYTPSSSLQSGKYLIRQDRIKNNLKPKTLFEDGSEKMSKEDGKVREDEKLLVEDADNENSLGDDLDRQQDSVLHDDSADNSSTISSETEIPEIQGETSDEQMMKTSQCGTKNSTPEKDSDKNAVESVKSNLATPITTTAETGTATEKVTVVEAVAAVETAISSSSIPTISLSKVNGSSEKVDDNSKVRKLVSVKNIKSINATVLFNAVSAKPVDVLTKTVSSPELNVTRNRDAISSKPTSPLADISRLPKSSIDERKYIQAVSENVSNPASRKNSDSKNGSEEIVCLSSTSTTDVSFDLNKVKDEPLDGSLSESEKSDLMMMDETPPPTVENKRATAVLNANPKRSFENEDEVSVKKSKTDPTCRTVNITENVTMTLINQDGDASKNRVITSVKSKQPMKQSNRVVYSSSNTGEMNPNMRMKTVASTKSIAMTTATNHVSTTTNKSSIKVPTRTVNNVPNANVVHMRKTSLPVTFPSPRLDTKSAESQQNPIRSIVDECTAKFSSSLTSIIEETLDEIACKGSLQAKVILLSQEIQNIKRNHEIILEEMKRDFEVQIAELRATSIAKTQFDIASERLKFEQEKERAVKEAKSKQWCSNCQKSANYYCCWNTAYCDFECQKDHWIQHMHVCKNDVKKKMPESSENEPPRIMMQNDDSSNYLLNGYDKTNSTYYQNTNSGVPSRNNFNRIQLKNTNMIRAPRPLLPRVAATVSSTQSSTLSPSVSVCVPGTTIVGSALSTYTDNNGYQSICNSGGTTLRPSVYTSLNNHSFLRQQSTQYHK